MLWPRKPTRKAVRSSSELELLAALVRDVLGERGTLIALAADTRFEDIGFDSIKYLDLLLRLEEIVDLDIETIVSNIDLGAVQTLGEAAEFVSRLRTRR